MMQSQDSIETQMMALDAMDPEVIKSNLNEAQDRAATHLQMNTLDIAMNKPVDVTRFQRKFAQPQSDESSTVLNSSMSSMTNVTTPLDSTISPITPNSVMTLDTIEEEDGSEGEQDMATSPNADDDELPPAQATPNVTISDDEIPLGQPSPKSPNESAVNKKKKWTKVSRWTLQPDGAQAVDAEEEFKSPEMTPRTQAAWVKIMGIPKNQHLSDKEWPSLHADQEPVSPTQPVEDEVTSDPVTTEPAWRPEEAEWVADNYAWVEKWFKDSGDWRVVHEKVMEYMTLFNENKMRADEAKAKTEQLKKDEEMALEMARQEQKKNDHETIEAHKRHRQEKLMRERQEWADKRNAQISMDWQKVDRQRKQKHDIVLANLKNSQQQRQNQRDKLQADGLKDFVSESVQRAQRLRTNKFEVLQVDEHNQGQVKPKVSVASRHEQQQRRQQEPTKNNMSSQSKPKQTIPPKKQHKQPKLTPTKVLPKPQAPGRMQSTPTKAVTTEEVKEWMANNEQQVESWINQDLNPFKEAKQLLEELSRLPFSNTELQWIKNNPTLYEKLAVKDNAVNEIKEWASYLPNRTEELPVEPVKKSKDKNKSAIERVNAALGITSKASVPSAKSKSVRTGAEPPKNKKQQGQGVTAADSSSEEEDKINMFEDDGSSSEEEPYLLSPNEPAWRPDDEHHDANQVYGSVLRKKVKTTKFSGRQGIAGIPTFRLKLTDLLWQGRKSWNLRRVSEGRWTTMLMLRSLDEVCVCEAITKIARDKTHGFAWRELAKKIAKAHDVTISEKGARREMWTEVASVVVDGLKTYAGLKQHGSLENQVNDLTQQVSKLLEQLQYNTETIRHLTDENRDLRMGRPADAEPRTSTQVPVQDAEEGRPGSSKVHPATSTSATPVPQSTTRESTDSTAERMRESMKRKRDEVDKARDSMPSKPGKSNKRPKISPKTAVEQEENPKVSARVLMAEHSCNPEDERLLAEIGTCPQRDLVEQAIDVLHLTSDQQVKMEEIAEKISNIVNKSPSEIHKKAYVAEIKAVAASWGLSVEIISKCRQYAPLLQVVVAASLVVKANQASYASVKQRNMLCSLILSLCELIHSGLIGGEAIQGSRWLIASVFTCWIHIWRCSVLKVNNKRRETNLFNKMQLAGVDFNSLSVPDFLQPFALYIGASPSSRHVYIGCTVLNTVERHQARIRAIRSDPSKRVEGSVRWWRKHRNLGKFVFVPLRHNIAPNDLEWKEDLEIHNWGSQLNHPWVVKLLTGNSRTGSHAWKKIGAKMWRRRLVRRQRGMRGLSSSRRQVTVDLVRAVKQLHQAAKGSSISQISFRKRLAQLDPVNTYLLFKLSENLMEPQFSSARAVLKDVCHLQNIPIPRRPKMGKFSPLPTNQYARRVANMLREVIRTCSEYGGTVPLHRPPPNVVLGRGNTVEQVLGNRRIVENRIMLPNDEIECVCGKAYKKHASDVSSNGHLVWRGGYMKGLSKEFSKVASSNLKETVFPVKEEFVLQVSKDTEKFCTDNQLFLSTTPNGGKEVLNMVKTWASNEWEEANERVQENGLLTMSLLTKFRKAFRGVVWYCEDHEYSRLVGYCPQGYHSCYLQTLVFNLKMVHDTKVPMAVALKWREEALPKAILQRHKWACVREEVVPTATVIPKNSKEYAKGRPIIRFYKVLYAFLQKAVARALGVMLREVLGHWSSKAHADMNRTDELGMFIRSVNKMIRKRLSSELPVELEFANQDLSGFFTNVPHSRILSCTQRLIQMWCDRKAETDSKFCFETATIKVQMSQAKLETDCWYPVHVKDVMPVVLHLLEFSVFQIGDHAFQQIHGACIGAPLSPIICSIVVTMHEFLWFKLSNDPVNFDATRYVDNRATFNYSRDERSNQWLDPEFYHKPVVLEDEGHQVLLGSSIKLAGSVVTAKYKVPGLEETLAGNLQVERWRYKSNNEARDMAANYGTIIGRLILAVRSSSSNALGRAAAAEAVFVIRQVLGPDSVSIILKAIYRVQQKKKVVWGDGWVKQLVSIVRSNSGWKQFFKQNDDLADLETKTINRSLDKLKFTSKSVPK